MKIFPLGDNALTIDFGNLISNELNDTVIQIQALINNNPFVGIIETVAAYSSLTVFFDVYKVKNHYKTALLSYEFVKEYVQKLLQNIESNSNKTARFIKIPILINAESALDLKSVANYANLSVKEVVDIFINQTYRVFMIGFLPAFAYMGQVDERIAVPRRNSPRQQVPKGSIGIAGRQTGIYPFNSPGGWQIIGKTDVEMFTPNAETPSFLQSGDIVQFVSET